MGNSYPTRSEHHAHMRMRQRQNRKSCLRSKSESWAFDLLTTRTSIRWTRQAQSGFRIFDFWSHELGIAVEIDGPEHDRAKDAENDKWQFGRRSIVVLRVRNLNEDDMRQAIEIVSASESWTQRREKYKGEL